MKIPGGLSLEEWVEYWREGNRQHIEDGITLLSTIRDDLAFASATIKELQEKIRGLETESESLRGDLVAIIHQRNRMFDALARSCSIVCSMDCPSTGKTGEPIPHNELCREINAIIDSVPKGLAAERK